MLEPVLKNMYYKDDNANSLFFHYLGTTGIFGVSLVTLIIYQYFKMLVSIKASKIIHATVFIFLLVSINFQRELFTTNTMYLLIGILLKKNFTYENNNSKPSKKIRSI